MNLSTASQCKPAKKCPVHPDGIGRTNQGVTVSKLSQDVTPALRLGLSPIQTIPIICNAHTIIKSTCFVLRTLCKHIVPPSHVIFHQRGQFP